MRRADSLQAETCRLEAWPAIHTEVRSGWVLRSMLGGYSRTNSVWPGRFEDGADLEAAIDDAESFYRRRGLTSCFQILSIAMPEGLDAALASRGYGVETPCLTMVKDVDAGAPAGDVDITRDVTPAWLALYQPTLREAKARELPVILQSITYPTAFAVFRIGAVPAGIGLGVKVGTDVSVDCMLTANEYRRRGIACAVLGAIETWSAHQGARRIALSVVADNVAAVGLYERLGFTRLGGYHYRVLAPSGGQVRSLGTRFATS